jgi:hypothetical protein
VGSSPSEDDVCEILRAMAFKVTVVTVDRDGIFKFLMSPGIDFKRLIPPAYVAWRAGTTSLIPTRFLTSIDCSKIPAQ